MSAELSEHEVAVLLKVMEARGDFNKPMTRKDLEPLSRRELEDCLLEIHARKLRERGTQ